MTEAPAACTICEKPIAGHMLAWCGMCGAAYHLNNRSDLPGDDCGEVWIDEEHLALEFACHRCLHPEEAEAAAALDDILDVTEAAVLAGISEARLTAAADGGEIRSRRTGSGLLLFRRADALAFREVDHG